ncbi:MAG: molybdate transport system substrate-binding protein [Flavobacteriaceae bacterium]|jgi:molybdate transport system substrate-binding protein
MFRGFHSTLLLLSLLGLLACGSGGDLAEDNPVVLKIATAANMQLAMDSITSVFYDVHGIKCEVTSNSSGMLTAQIQSGAPFDLFFSGNMRYPNELIKTGFGESVQVYAYGKLALIYPKGKHYKSPEELLLSASTKRIGLADKKTAPYGIAAKSYLKKSGLADKLSDKIVVGESVGQVNQYIKTKAVDAAFTSYSYVKKFEDDFHFMDIDQKYYPEIEQGALILKSGRKHHPEEAKEFFEFLFSEKCQEILKYFGYTVD